MIADFNYKKCCCPTMVLGAKLVGYFENLQSKACHQHAKIAINVAMILILAIVLVT